MPDLAALPEHGDRREQGRRARVHIGSPSHRPLGNAGRRGVLHQPGGRHVVLLGDVGRESVDEKWTASTRLMYLGSRFVCGHLWPALRERTLGPTRAERLKGASRGVPVSSDVREQLGCARGRDRTGGKQDRHRQPSHALCEVQQTPQARFVGEVGVVHDEYQWGCPSELTTQRVQTVELIERELGSLVSALGRKQALLARHVLEELNHDTKTKPGLASAAAAHQDLHACLSREWANGRQKRGLSDPARSLEEQHGAYARTGAA